jgi:nicotinate dehydrogenase subunit A
VRIALGKVHMSRQVASPSVSQSGSQSAAASAARVTEIRVNGRKYSIDADPETPLLTVLREQLDLTGSKYGCGEGQCGACTVLIGNNPRHSCVTAVGAAAAKEITTIEGIAQNGKLHPLQQAFLDEGAMQCAYCTSGMIITGVALLKTNPTPSDAEIVEYMQGNVCRCGTYPRIVAAVRGAARAMKTGAPAAGAAKGVVQ